MWLVAAAVLLSVVLGVVSGVHPPPQLIPSADFTGHKEPHSSHKLPSSSSNELKMVELVGDEADGENYSRLATLPPPGLLQESLQHQQPLQEGDTDVLGHVVFGFARDNFVSEFEDGSPGPQPSGGRVTELQERQGSAVRPLPNRGAGRGRARPAGSRRPPPRSRQQQQQQQDLHQQLVQQLQQQQQPRPQLTPSHPDISLIPLQPLQDHDGASDWPGERFPPYTDSFPPFPPQAGASITLPPPGVPPLSQVSQVQQRPQALQLQGTPQAPRGVRVLQGPQTSTGPEGLRPHRVPHSLPASQAHEVPPVSQALHVITAPQLASGLTAPQPPEGSTTPQVSSGLQPPENFQIVLDPQVGPQPQGSQVHRIPRGPRVPRIPRGPQVPLRRPLRGIRPQRPGRTPPHHPRNHFRGPRRPQVPSSRDGSQSGDPRGARPGVRQPRGQAEVFPSRRPSLDLARTSPLSSGEVVATRKVEGGVEALETSHPAFLTIIDFTKVPTFTQDLVEKADVISQSDVDRGPGGVQNGSVRPSRAGRKGRRPGVVEALRNKLPRSLGLSQAGRKVQKRLEKLVGGAAARASLVGQVAGELLGAGVVAAGQAGHALSQAMSKHAEGPPSYQTHTFASGLQLTVPHKDHVTHHRFGVRFDLSSRYPESLLPVLGLGIDTNVLAKRLPDGKDPPPAFLGPYTHTDSSHHVLPSHHVGPYYPHTRPGGPPHPPVHYSGPVHPPIHHGGPPHPLHIHENYIESDFNVDHHVDHLADEPELHSNSDVFFGDSHLGSPHQDGQLVEDYTHGDQSKYIPEPPGNRHQHHSRPRPKSPHHHHRHPCRSGKLGSVARVYIPGPQPYVDCGLSSPPRHHQQPSSPLHQHNLSNHHHNPENIDDIKEIINDPSYPADYYRESFRPKDLRRGKSSETKNPIGNPTQESDVPNMRPDWVDIEAELNPYAGAEDLRHSILQKEEEFVVLDAISQSDQENYFDEVLLLQDEG